MESASREAYGPALARLNQLAAASRPHGQSAGPGPVSGVADEILAVATVLQREPRLRRALADPSRTGEERAGLIGTVVQTHVSPEASELLRTLVAGRWSSGNDLLGSVELLGVQALLANAQAAGELAAVEDELFRFGQVVDGDLQLASALGASTAPVAQRAELARSLLHGKVRPVTVRLVTQALHGFGGRSFSGALTRLVELAAQRREQQIAYVTVAAPLTATESERLAARLAQIYGRPVEVKVTVAPEVLGGVSVRVGDDLWDGTVRHRLNETRAALVAKK